MTLFERISNLAVQKNKSLKEVAEDLGLSRNALYQWKTSSPNSETLRKVAEYFNVSTDYLLGRTENRYSGLSEEQKEFTIEQALDNVMTYNNKPVTGHDREVLRRLFETYLDTKKED